MHFAREGTRYSPGIHLLQIPGPTNVPSRVRMAIAQPTIDHRGAAFADLARGLFPDLRQVFGTRHSVVIFPSSGTGAWEAALLNATAVGDEILMAETGHFSALWFNMARQLGRNPRLLPGDWRRAVRPDAVNAVLTADKAHAIRGVCIVHNETSTGVTSDIAAVREAIDDAKHPALLLVDTVSSLGSMPYSQDEWGVDVTVAGSQKGLMLPPGLAFNAYGPRALEARRRIDVGSVYFDWMAMRECAETGAFPYTPATNLLFGLRAALDMLLEEGLDAVFARHARHARAAQAAVESWGLEILCSEPPARSNSLTAVVMPDGRSADRFRVLLLERFGMSLGNGLSKLKDRIFRIGHLGDFNDPMLLATLSCIQLGLNEFGINSNRSGVEAALAVLAQPAHSASQETLS